MSFNFFYLGAFCINTFSSHAVIAWDVPWERHFAIFFYAWRIPFSSNLPQEILSVAMLALVNSKASLNSSTPSLIVAVL